VTIDNPKKYPKEGLPTQLTPVNLNGVHYSSYGQILATGYHRSEIIIIDYNGSLQMVDLKLKYPHSFQELANGNTNKFMVVNTGEGNIMFMDKNFRPTFRVGFGSLPSDNEKKSGFGEWLQTANPINDSQSVFAAVDALRNGVHIVDINRRRHRFISNPPEWTIQTVAKAPIDGGSILEKINRLSAQSSTEEQNSHSRGL
jgi:hypothetical protein